MVNEMILRACDYRNFKLITDICNVSKNNQAASLSGAPEKLYLYCWKMAPCAIDDILCVLAGRDE